MMKKTGFGLAAALLLSVSIPAMAHDGSFPGWLVIGLYEGTINPALLSDMGYGDFDWANMTPAERLRLYNSAMEEAEENS